MSDAVTALLVRFARDRQIQLGMDARALAEAVPPDALPAELRLAEHYTTWYGVYVRSLRRRLGSPL